MESLSLDWWRSEKVLSGLPCLKDRYELRPTIKQIRFVGSERFECFQNGNGKVVNMPNIEG